MIPAIQYRRVSTKEQDDKGFSPETQDHDNRTYAERNGLAIVADFFDDESGMILERPGFTAAREFLTEHSIKVIIAHNNDRITRHPVHYSLLRDEWEMMGVELHYSLRGKISFDFGGQVSEDIYGRFAKEWWRTLLERTRKGKRTKVSQGNVIVSQRPPYGYRFAGDQLVIIEEEAGTIRLIFGLYVINGYSTAKIAQYLTQKRVPTHADLYGKSAKKNGYGIWLPRTVYQILSNETYAGVWYWGKRRRQKQIIDGKRRIKWIDAPRPEWIAVDVPAIVDRAIWEKAQERFTTNRERAARNMRHRYLLSKRLTCDHCDHRLYCQAENGQTRYKYYYCSSRQHKQFPGFEWCALPFLRVDRFDDAMWYWLKKVLSDPEYLGEIIEASLETDTGEYEAMSTELEEIQRRIASKERELKRLLLAFAQSDDDDTSDIEAVRTEVKTDLKELKERERALVSVLANVAPVDKTLAFSQEFYLFQQGLDLRDDEPFEIRAAWIDAVDLTARVESREGQKFAHIKCLLKDDLLAIANGTVWSIPRNVLTISHTLNLTELGV